MSDNQPKRKILGPFNRVEGDLEVKVEVSDGEITNAWVNSPLFRGYEQIMQGKEPLDALVYTPRICGICSVSQSVAAAQSIASAAGSMVEENGRLATNIILATENLADHLTHFYLFFMPDFARECYAGYAWHAKTKERFKAQIGSVYNQVLPARSSFLHITGILAGKWPHSLAIQPGGTTKSVAAQEKVKLLTLVNAFRYFLETVLFASELESVTSLENESQLIQFIEENPQGDFSHFLKLSRELDLKSAGVAADQFMSFGAYQDGQSSCLKSGIWYRNATTAQQLQLLDQTKINEDLANSWLRHQLEPKHPFQGNTIADEDENSGYSWCKAPRYDGQVMEVGAVARQVVDGHPLIRDLVNRYGGNVEVRVVARLLELALLLPKMENWIKQIRPEAAFCAPLKLPKDCQGFGMVEAARGSLGHWLRVKNGKILNYQIIAPTTWNFSPRDSQNQEGALELALKNTRVGELHQIDGNTIGAAKIQHIIRSFDPCMVCTVH